MVSSLPGLAANGPAASRSTGGLSPTMAARQLGLGRSTVYREVSRAGIQRGT
jgi:transcriptional regulator of acetoin/glycerol metabolism